MAGAFNSFCAFYFTVCEPIFAWYGTYMCFFTPLDFIQLTLVANHKKVSALERGLLYQLGCMYLLFGICGAFVLRYSRDKRLWRILVLACILTDTGHLIGVAITTGADHFWKFWEWSVNEIINNGILFFGMALRLGWLVAN